ncbi:hypothetical protein ACOSP7_004471 [Xanthoceras sorbifolium]
MPNNLERNLEMDNGNEPYFVMVMILYILHWMGSASTSVDNFFQVVLTQEDLESNNVFCAVFKYEISVGEKVKLLLCVDQYYGHCNVTWLAFGNTCLVLLL